MIGISQGWRLGVFPADAGMNRRRGCEEDQEARVPRGRGDEPEELRAEIASMIVFPADAGMNRDHGGVSPGLGCVPRGRGDEPFPAYR